MKRKTHFHFKQFSVRHDQCTMKVGTDAVLLGSWANVSHKRNILDIGTGSGIIALMVAQRSSPDAKIDAVEIEMQDAKQALENISNSPWSAKICVHCLPVQEFAPPYKYDVIISNPPYFNNSQEPPDKRRHQTRHTTLLNYDTLISTVRSLLKGDGKFNIVLPNSEGLQFITLALQNNFFCTRKYSFRTRTEKPIERWLLEFSRNEQTIESGEVLLYKEGEVWSDNYVDLTRDFYLKL